jgi:hypothetical protein
MAIQTKVLVEVPRTPNFIKVGGSYISIGSISEQTLKEVAQDWTNELMRKARAKRTELSLK